MAIIFCVVFTAVVFEYINGFHDTANSIATVVSTKVLTPRQAVIFAAGFNLLGAMAGTAVASTIGKGLVDIQFVTSGTILCGLFGAIIWNLITWYVGLPSSSSHALVGGIIGSTLAAAHGDWSVVKFFETKEKIVQVLDPVTHQMINKTVIESGGIIPKVVVPMFTSPLAGLIIGFVIMGLLYFLLRNWRPHWVNVIFGKLQLLSSAGMSFSHGTNDAQKTMGILTLALVTATAAGTFDHLPASLSFLRMPLPAKGQALSVPFWIKLLCAITMAAGTWAGGWRIIRTMGTRMVRLQPVHGFAAETTAATIIQVASHWGIPLSTTHVIAAAIMGVGSAKRLNAVKWTVVERMVWAWILTIPVTASLGFLFVHIAQMFGWIK